MSGDEKPAGIATGEDEARWISLPGTPRERGYRMPAEWEPQTTTWLAWPHNEETYQAYLPAVYNTYLEFIRALVGGQTVSLLVTDESMELKVRDLLVQAGIALDRVSCYRVPTVDTWIRDYGPTFVVARPGTAPAPLAMVCWTFNAWGGKYADLARDDGVPRAMNAQLQLPVFEPGIVLEGGSIDVNGRGTVLTTEQCLLNPNRNPALSRADVEAYLRDYLDASHVLWLAEGIVGDDTDGHIDDVARFVDARTVVCAYEDDPGDANYEALHENYHRLQAMTDQDGHPLRVLKVPMPGEVEVEDTRLPASYLNFYVGNAVVVVPTFRHVNDQRACEILQGLFPDRRVVGIDCRGLVYGLGALHCCSQQQPAVPAPADAPPSSPARTQRVHAAVDAREGT